MNEQQLDRWKSDIIGTGFGAKRFQALVYGVRRVLWPFVRPYHWYTLERIAEVEGRIVAGPQVPSGLTNEIWRVQTELSRLRTEVAAAVNRQLATEAAADQVDDTFAQTNERIDGALAQLNDRIDGALAQANERIDGALAQVNERIDGALAQINDRIDGVDGHLAKVAERIDDALAQVNERIDGVDNRLTKVAERTGQIDSRTKLVLSASHHGLVLVKEGEYLSDVVLRDGVWDEHIVALIDEVVASRNGTAVDVGAHLGLLTVIMADRFRNVLSFEPNPVNFGVLNANVALRRLQNVTCINNALFSREIDLSLGQEAQQEVAVPLTASGDIDWVSSRNLGALTWTENGTGLFQVRAKPLDSYALEDVAFIKIDAQGADGEVLLGARETLQRCRPVVVFEWEEFLSRNCSVTLADVRAFLTGLGYSLDQLRVYNEKQVDYVARPVAR